MSYGKMHVLNYMDCNSEKFYRVLITFYFYSFFYKKTPYANVW